MCRSWRILKQQHENIEFIIVFCKRDWSDDAWNNLVHGTSKGSNYGD